MRNRNLILLCVLAIISIAAACLGLWQSSNARHALAVDRTLFPGVADRAGDIARIEIQGGGQSAILLRAGKGWVLPQKDRYPADADRINNLIASLTHLVLVEKKTDNPKRYADLNLALSGTGSGTEVKLFDAKDNVIADAVIGRAAPALSRIGGGFYVRRADEPASWLAEGVIDVPVNALAWAPRDLFDLYDANAIRLATLSGDGKTILTVKRSKPEDETLQITPVPPGKADQSKALRLLTLPVSLPYDDVKAIPDAIKPTRIALFKSFATGVQYNVTVVNDGWVKVEETGSGDAVKRFNEFHAHWLYKLPPDRQQMLTGDLRADK